jgi:two-component system sensor histidine kinase VicK
VELPSSTLEVFVNVDAVWQALMNIILNAIRFTPDGGNVAIKAHSVGNYVEVQISDTGIGIPEDEVKNIFKRFYVVGDVMHHTSGTIEFKSEGMGVGLSIAKAAVELNNGKIWVESELGNGSTFYFTLPKDIRVGKEH